MSKEEIKDMIETIPNWKFTYRYDGSRTCGKSYTQNLLDEKDKQIKDLQKKVEQLEEMKKEIERLNNIINELEKYLEEFDFTVFICCNRKASKSIELGARLNNDFILNKLKELKEDK